MPSRASFATAIGPRVTRRRDEDPTILGASSHSSSRGAIQITRLGVLIVYCVIQLLEGLVITPRVVGGKLGFSPVWVLFALLAFGNLFGALIKVFVLDALAYYQRSALYLGNPNASAVGPRPGRLRLRRANRARTARRVAR